MHNSQIKYTWILLSFLYSKMWDQLRLIHMVYISNKNQNQQGSLVFYFDTTIILWPSQINKNFHKDCWPVLRRILLEIM